MFDKAEMYKEISESYKAQGNTLMWVSSILGTAAYYYWFFVRELNDPTYTLMLVSAIVAGLLYGRCASKADEYENKAKLHSYKQEEWSEKRYKEVLWEERRALYTEEELERFEDMPSIKPKVSVVPASTHPNVVEFPQQQTN